MQEIFSTHPAYFLMASLGTGLFLIKLLLFLFSGDGEATDFEDAEHIDGSETFSLLSIQSILAFFMGTGWTGLAAKIEWGMTNFQSLGVSFTFGFLMMLLNSYLSFKLKKLNTAPRKTDYQEIVGHKGRAYTHIPPKGEGMGQVEITLEGKQQILQAISEEESIPAFSPVKIISIDDAGTLLVIKN